MSAREEILGRIRRAQAGRDVVVPRDYRGAGEAEVPDVVDLFVHRVAEYRAEVHRCAAGQVSTTLADVLPSGARVLAAPGVPAEYLTDTTVSLLADDATPSTADLDTVDGVVTTCACAVALTGTIVLDHGPSQGHRAFTLVPDRHFVIVRSDQIVAGVPDAIARTDATAPQTWISGPSATSDIELNRVEGVHGPRNLIVLVVD